MQTDLRYFCQKELRIKLKEGGDAPFVWNRAQQYLHARIEKQLRDTGRVRMFILKGRQQGISTYIAARFYHKARQRGRRVFILSHHSSTTGTLFQIVSRYHEAVHPAAKPAIETDNNRQLIFDNQSQYTVGTAGTGSVGRGDTTQYLHWSEVAFSDNISELLTGIAQTVAEVDGTEKLYESTANGIGNYFYRGCMQALQDPEDEYELVFIPWFWQEEYKAKPREGFQRTEEEERLRETYGLTDEQLQWRRNKINELKKDGHGISKFKQEYPCSVREAFQASGDSLVDMDMVAQARKRKLTDQHAPLILGVDPAPIKDRTAITWRRGREWQKTEIATGLNQIELAHKLAHRIDRYNVDKVFIDVAEGRACVDLLHQMGYHDVVVGISFAQKPADEGVYANKRAEMHGEAKAWLEDSIGVSIPDVDMERDTSTTMYLASGEDIEVEIGVIPVFKTTGNGRKQMPSKDEIKKEYGQSPDIWDSFILTFAQPVKSAYNRGNRIRKKIQRTRSEIDVINRRYQQPSRPDRWDDDDDAPKGFIRANRPVRLR